MRIRTLTTINHPDPRGGLDIYHGGLEFDVDDGLGAQFVTEGRAVDLDAPEPEPETKPGPAPETEDETGDAGEEE